MHCCSYCIHPLSETLRFSYCPFKAGPHSKESTLLWLVSRRILLFYPNCLVFSLGFSLCFFFLFLINLLNLCLRRGLILQHLHKEAAVTPDSLETQTCFLLLENHHDPGNTTALFVDTFFPPFFQSLNHLLCIPGASRWYLDMCTVSKGLEIRPLCSSANVGNRIGLHLSRWLPFRATWAMSHRG